MSGEAPATRITPLTRRTFLERTAAGGAALVIAFHLDGDLFAQEPKEKKTPNPFDAWIRIAKDGSVTLVLAKSEMGQGVMTSLPTILAEELDVDWAKVKVEQAPTDPTVYDLGTGGSSSVRTSWLPLRQAGAAARQMLVQAAARHWQVNPNACTTELGHVMTGPRQKHLSYGELVEAAAKLPVPPFDDVTLRNPDEFRLVGTSVPRVDVPSKVDGSARFGLDVRVPGMLFAVIARCPTYGGKPLRFDAARAKAVAGVKHVIEIPAVPEGAFTAGGVAVVAESTWAAIQGRAALDVEWDPGPNRDESSAAIHQRMEELLAQPGKLMRNDGDAEAALEKAAHRIEAVYELPFEAHATMEPMNATVHVRPDGAEAWLPSQGPQWGQDMIAKIGGVPSAKVVVHTTLLGGGFGRRYHADFVVEATQVSKAVGAPVQVVWTREDDIQHDFYRPAAMHRFEAGLDADGKPVAWTDRMTSTSIDGFWTPADRAKPESTEIDGAVNLPYAIPNVRMEYAYAKTPVPVMWWRSVEHSINGFAVESFLDELAAAAKADPLEFRRRLLAEPKTVRIPADGPELETARLLAVLELAAAKADWGRPLPPGRGRGIACHFSFDTYAAEVAEVSVDAGVVRVHRVVAAVDCGRAVNPDEVRSQTEGCVVYGLSAALKGAITVGEGRCLQSNFDDFEVLRLPEMPLVEVHIVPSREKPTGTGEPELPPLAAAVANAIFAATGKRVRRLPVQPADLA
jgi:isoquinoline 1-oxidoreductase subunit beta